MASLQRRFVRGHAYYYLVESRRLKGRPRPIILQYLGSADTLWQRLRQASAPPLRARVVQFGGVAALYDLAQQLQLVACIDQSVPQRKQGPSLGQYMLVAAINRCLAPTIKLQMPAWLRSTPCSGGSACPPNSSPPSVSGTTWSCSPKTRWRPSAKSSAAG